MGLRNTRTEGKTENISKFHLKNYVKFFWHALNNQKDLHIIKYDSIMISPVKILKSLEKYVGIKTTDLEIKKWGGI